MAPTTAHAAQAQAQPPVLVKGGPIIQLHPSFADSWLGWEHSYKARPHHFDYFVQRNTGRPIKVNAPDTQGLGGGIFGNTVVYGQAPNGSQHQTLYRFNLRTRHRFAYPAKANKPFASDPTISGPWILFHGIVDSPPVDAVMLYNRSTGKLRTLAKGEYRSTSPWPGQVNGRYLTWTRRTSFIGAPNHTDVFVYDVKTHARVRLTREKGTTPDGGAAVSASGTVYFTRYRAPTASIAAAYELVRYPRSGPIQVLGSFPEPIYQPYVWDRTDGAQVVYFGQAGDIYKMVVK